MGWKRRRERGRTLPQGRKPREGFGVHWGRYAKIPKVPGGPEIGLSTSGTVEESRPWSLWKWIVMLLVGTAAAFVFFPLLFAGIVFVGLAAVFAVGIHRQWRD